MFMNAIISHHCIQYLRAFCVVVAWYACVCSANAERQYQTDTATGAISLLEGNQLCWTYVPQSKEGKPYFHPLNIPGTEISLTSFRPPDHSWHLGLWFSWKFINGINFWEPDSNNVTRVLSQTVMPPTNISQPFRVDVELAYVAHGKELVREHRAVRVTLAAKGSYTIDWDSTFTAQKQEVTFATTPVKKDKNGMWVTGGYAGLMWRFADGLSLTYTNAAGQADILACGEKSATLEVIAESKTSGAKAKISFRDHPENPRYPTPWFARHSATAHGGRGYYLVGPSAIFHKPITLPAEESARFRYTLTVERL